MHARVAELADALDLGSSVFRRVGSSPSARTTSLRLDQIGIGFISDAYLLALIYQLFPPVIIRDNNHNHSKKEYPYERF